MKARRRSYMKRMQDIVHRYMDAHGVDQVDLDDVYAWAVDEDLWEAKPYDPRRQFRREAARALQVEYITDPKGRDVRRMHSIPIKGPDGQQLWEWAEIYSMKPGGMRLSLAARRNSSLNDVKQQKRDHDSYNDFNKHGAVLEPQDFDFNADLAEDENPSDYPDAPPDGE